jgi:hypothetical protein
MADVLRKFRETCGIEYGCVGLRDPRLSLDDAWMHDGHLEVQSGRVRVECDVSYGNADIRMESWDAEPPAADAPWVEAGEVTYLSGTGIVELLGFDGQLSHDRLVLGPSYFLYGVRAYRVPSARERDHEFWEDPRIEHVLLRFWPIRDVFDPVLHARPDSWERTTPPGPSPYPPSADWPTLRRQPAVSPGESGVAADEVDDPYQCWELAKRKVRLRIAGELNPSGAPTFSIRKQDLIAPWRAAPGLTGRVQVWQPDPCSGTDMLAADRRIVTRDVSRGQALVSAIVTVLDEEGDSLTVRDAISAEAARVIAAEQTWK